MNIKANYLASLFVIAAAMCIPVAAHAEAQQNFVIHNMTGTTIDQVYIVPPENIGWGPDKLGRDSITPSNTYSFYTKGVCVWDFKLVYSNGATQTGRVNTCNTSHIDAKPTGIYL